MQHDDIDTLVDRYNAITPAMLRRVAEEIITPAKAMTLIYHPAGRQS